ncbi:hypothetical protein BD324DRAFT_321282 [Kockovaella imperatae]|uniref:Zn(2)-C6 fungal-type domain-containing protein n=1 Tax=Kockovaella imperatae TaxID=4999 RepID=A0A1Y1UP52_9TREE|nr:hypothetical protein BD324DRAFT_321282 [Kockovaella imperatae]ORX39256.1 hypothetical protein BD324DRAFT_321282 [Kockovaella imperatae]
MGGDHKCPLCEATFTRPQHVGRHLRAHTGDRPYECKECPLRFARSDLLSRHVNKAHRAPEEGGGKPMASKKGRRKSMPTTAHPRQNNTDPVLDDPNKLKKPTMTRNRSHSLVDAANVFSTPGTDVSEPHPALQAQRMYPHHPLLANPDLQTTGPLQNTTQWSNFTSLDGLNSAPLTTAVPLTNVSPIQGIDTSAYTGQMKFPMQFSTSDHGIGSSSMGRNSSSSSSISYDYVKKRACDQCSHSKVRCDFAEPCQRCSTRNIACSYTKTPKSRVLSSFPAQRQSYPGSPFRSSTLPGLSISPVAFTPSPLGGGTLMAPNSITGTSVSPTSIPSTLLPNLQQTPSTMVWSPNSLSDGQPTPINPQMLQAGNSLSAPQPLHMGANTVQMSNLSPANLPLNTFAPTPSLTSLTTSPSGSEEPVERRGSQTSSLTFTNPLLTTTNLKHQNATLGVDGTQMNPSLGMGYNSGMQTDLNNFRFGGMQDGTIDPRIQFRNQALIEDDEETASNPKTAPPTAHGNAPVSAVKALNELDFDKMKEDLNQRRRSSIGLWGFNNMSLRDGNGENTIPDPFTASMMAQEHQRNIEQLHRHIAAAASGQKDQNTQGQTNNWNTVPRVAPGGAAINTNDAKDIWKTFMADPSGSQGVQGSSSNVNRPDMSARSLSKSSSMPDLQSPFEEPAQIPHPPVNHAPKVQDDTDAMKRWRNEIRNRQSQTTFALAPGSTTTGGNKMKLDPAAFLEGLAGQFGNGMSRPVASVFQSSALQQTLAPERTPSFGLENLPTPFRAAFAFPGMSSSVGTRPGLGSNLSNQSNTGAWPWKATSVSARPGAKRLASQTLVADAPKVGRLGGGGGATFTFWDDDDGAGGAGGMDGLDMVGSMGSGLTPTIAGDVKVG